MISIITCARNPRSQTKQERNIAKTVGTEHEYLLYDNSSGVYSFASVYNQGATQARGDILVFIYDDVFFMKPGWGKVLEMKFANDKNLGLVGVAGSQYLFNDNPSLTAAGRPFIKGRIIHDLQNGDFFAVVFSQENGNFEVVACDGLFMAIPRALFGTVWFDVQTFDKEQFHDLDICMQLRRNYRIIVTTEIVVKKRSATVFDKNWQDYGKRFLEKWAAELPATCTDASPPPKTARERRSRILKVKFRRR